MSGDCKLRDMPKASFGFSVPKNNPCGILVHHTKSARRIPHSKLTALYKHVIEPIHQKVLDQIDADIAAAK